MDLASAVRVIDKAIGVEMGHKQGLPQGHFYYSQAEEEEKKKEENLPLII